MMLVQPKKASIPEANIGFELLLTISNLMKI